jgi:hypothetical protein
MSVLDGQGETCSYGYFSNYNVSPLTVKSARRYFVEGEGLELFPEDVRHVYNVNWTLPDGTVVSNADTLNVSATEALGGFYSIEAQHEDGCQMLPDTVFVTVFPKNISGHDTIDVCFGSAVRLSAKDKGRAPYLWSDNSVADTLAFAAQADASYRVESYKQGGNMAALLTGTHLFSASGQFDYQLPADVFNDVNYLFSADVKIDDSALQPDLYFTVNGASVGGRIDVQSGAPAQYAETTWHSNSTSARIGIQNRNAAYSGEITVANVRFAPLFAIIDTFTVLVRDSLKPVLTADPALCNGTASLSVAGEYESYLWNTGETGKSITVSTAGDYWVKVSSADCSGTGFATVQPSPGFRVEMPEKYEICAGEEQFNVRFASAEGEAGKYSVRFSDPAVSAGFENKENAVPADGEITFALPQNLPVGIYSAKVEFAEKNCGQQQELPLELTVRYAANTITQRWNDVLAIKNEAYNGGYTFTEFQWYRNGELLAGETRPFLHTAADLKVDDRYCALLTASDGSRIFTCDFQPEHFTDIQLMPTYVGRQQQIGISETGTAVFRNSIGTIVSSQSISDGKITAPSAPGIYLLQINGRQVIRMVVE